MSAPRALNRVERARLASGEGVSDLALTCRGDHGYGPCGTYLDWIDGTCARGHYIEIDGDEIEDDGGAS